MAGDTARARLLAERARAAGDRGASARALALFDDALAELDERGCDPLVADVLRWKGTLLRESGDTTGANRLYLRSLAVAERAALSEAKAHALNCLAIVAQRRGDLREAERHYKNAAELALVIGDHRLLGMIEQNLGVLANMRGDFESAGTSYAKSLGAFERAEDTQAVSWVLNNIGMLHTRRKEYDDARTALERGLEIAVSRGDAVVESIVTLNLAELWIGTGEIDRAAGACARSLENAQHRGDHLTAAEALTCRAKIERERGAFNDGIATLRIARFEAEGSEDPLLQAEILREWGDISRAAGDGSGARSAWSRAAESYHLAGAIHDAAEVEACLSALEIH
jgi:tetratricopeptide (TPR) repeat protein